MYNKKQQQYMFIAEHFERIHEIMTRPRYLQGKHPTESPYFKEDKEAVDRLSEILIKIDELGEYFRKKV